MKIDSSPKIISAFALGYLLSLLTEQIEKNNGDEVMNNKLLLLINEELPGILEELCTKLMINKSEYNFSTRKVSDIQFLIKNLNDFFSEKDQRGDDSFLATAFFSGRFINYLRYVDEFEFDLAKLEKILIELTCALNIHIDYKEFYKLISKIISRCEEERKLTCEEIFCIISRNDKDYQKISGFQSFIERSPNLSVYALA